MNRQFEYEDSYHDGELVYEGEYNKYTFYILSFGEWPCVYVQLKHDVIEDLFDQWTWLRCHGGITYVKNYLKYIDTDTMEQVVIKEPFIGIDSHHACDKNSISSRYNDIEPRIWTNDMLIEQAHHIIDQVAEKNL